MREATTEHSDSIYKSHRHVLVVSLFIIAASMLVVLTTFAVNMLTATGDFNHLIVNWSQYNNKGNEEIVAFFETNHPDFKQAYEQVVRERTETGNVLNELMSNKPDAGLIFREYNLEEIHPTEITGLIRTFAFFADEPEVRGLKKSWETIQQLNAQKTQLIDSLLTIQLSSPEEEISPQPIYSLNRQLNTHIYEIIEGNSHVLLLLKRYSLWFTVLLGILIVLIGVIFTVRGVKQITQLKTALSERDYLAMFPKLNRYPVINVNTNGELGYINPAADALFPELGYQGMEHPFLKELKTEFSNLNKHTNHTILKEIKIDGKYYQQVLTFISKEKGIHLHAIDITTIKEQQNEISRSLEEKDALLAEVHHRVKNNMAVIVGLLELQEMLGDDPSTALSESKSRIKSMAIVHELLYESDHLSGIKTDQYLHKMAHHLQISLSSINKVEVMQHGFRDGLNINQAVPLGLLINELAIFICQQHQTDENPFNVLLGLKKRDELICLRMSVPFPDIQNPLGSHGKPTLRTNLIKSLLEQIEGDLYLPESNTETFTVEIRFLPSNKKGASNSYL
ncbi:MAG: hypothetical protein FH748_03620 [Balneolaceae bacterium]|nr:hypothetical protein [Balneolaceae bacterium]